MTWSRSAEELIVCFNRDEQHNRATSLPPTGWDEGFLAPRDADAGGSWLAAKPDGTLLALLNHYPPDQPFIPEAKSRGSLVTMLASRDVVPSASILRKLGVERMKPFRLVVLSRSTSVLLTWNGRRIMRKTLANEGGFITSSSWNTKPVTAARQKVYRQWRRTASDGNLADMIEFHSFASHAKGSAWAICMSRDDARTVSLNTVRVTNSHVEMTQQDRPLGSESFSKHIHRSSISP